MQKLTHASKGYKSLSSLEKKSSPALKYMADRERIFYKREREYNATRQRQIKPSIAAGGGRKVPQGHVQRFSRG
jgi:hypothetical protein